MYDEREHTVERISKVLGVGRAFILLGAQPIRRASARQRSTEDSGMSTGERLVTVAVPEVVDPELSDAGTGPQVAGYWKRPTYDRGMSEQSKCSTTLGDLERSARVFIDQQVTVQAEAPAEAPIAPEDLDRQRLLGITGAGRLRQS